MRLESLQEHAIHRGPGNRVECPLGSSDGPRDACGRTGTRNSASVSQRRARLELKRDGISNVHGHTKDVKAGGAFVDPAPVFSVNSSIPGARTDDRTRVNND